MRTTEERTRLIRKRTAELKRGQQRRKQRVWDCVCVAVCLLLVVGLGVWMPEWLSSPVSHSPAGTASLMGSHGALGYIVMGLLCFLLGVCVTVLLYRMRRRTKPKEDDHEL